MEFYIINTYEVFPVGIRPEAGEMIGQDGKYHEVFLEILRTATIEEYIEFCKEMDCENLIRPSIYNSNMRFYKVRVLD